MGLYLRSRDFDAIGAIADVLTAPLTFDSPCSWALDAAQRLRDFVGGEAAILYGSGFDAPGVWSVDLDSQIRERLSQFLGHTDTTPVLRSSDPIWDASLEQRRADHIDVYSMADVRTALGNVRLEDLPIYHEVGAKSNAARLWNGKRERQCGKPPRRHELMQWSVALPRRHAGDRSTPSPVVPTGLRDAGARWHATRRLTTSHQRATGCHGDLRW